MRASCACAPSRPLALPLAFLFALMQAGLAAMGADPAPAERVIQVTAEKFKYTPDTIQVKAGERVLLEVTSLDRKHGLKITDLDVDETIEPGKVTHIHLASAKPGTYEFHCSVFCGSGHEEMAGKIVVSP